MYLVPGSERILLVTEGIGAEEEKKSGGKASVHPDCACARADVKGVSYALFPLVSRARGEVQGSAAGVGGVSDQDELTAPDREENAAQRGRQEE